MEEDELNDLEGSSKKPLSEVLPDDVSFKASNADEEEKNYSTASESQH